MHLPSFVCALIQWQDRAMPNKEFVFNNPDFAGGFFNTLSVLQDDGSFVDVHVVVRGERFPLHKAILYCSSPYFQKQLQDVETTCIEIDTQDVTLSSFSLVVGYIYSGKLTVSIFNLPEVCITAKFLQLDSLVEWCQEKLKENNKPVPKVQKVQIPKISFPESITTVKPSTWAQHKTSEGGGQTAKLSEQRHCVNQPLGNLKEASQPHVRQIPKLPDQEAPQKGHFRITETVDDGVENANSSSSANQRYPMLPSDSQQQSSPLWKRKVVPAVAADNKLVPLASPVGRKPVVSPVSRKPPNLPSKGVPPLLPSNRRGVIVPQCIGENPPPGRLNPKLLGIPIIPNRSLQLSCIPNCIQLLQPHQQSDHRIIECGEANDQLCLEYIDDPEDIREHTVSPTSNPLRRTSSVVRNSLFNHWQI